MANKNKKKKRRRPPSYHTSTGGSQRDRIYLAMDQSRFQQALELSRQLFKQSPTDENRRLLIDACLGRATHLRQQGRSYDAIASLKSVAQVTGLTLDERELLARELAQCGDCHAALQLDDRPDVQQNLTAQAVDGALRQQEKGRSHLPEELRADFDTVLRAFELSHKGEDDAVRETLQGIGLRSPFMEWKVMLRGLAAFYQGDDDRALENWGRLSEERVPARLIAGLRSTVDHEYRASQSPEMREELQAEAKQLTNPGPSRDLQELQELLGSGAPLAQILRVAERIVTRLKAQQPEIVPRLAACLYWTILKHGVPEDLPRYKRIFGSPADDPTFARLSAMAFERHGNLIGAHRSWQAYEGEIAERPEVWPGDQAQRARALIWRRMGVNAVAHEDLEDDEDEMPFGLPRYDFRDNAPLEPNAEQCFKKSLKLAPDCVETLEALFDHYDDEHKLKKALKVGRDILKLTPDRLSALERLGNLLIEIGEGAEAVAIYQRAYRNNPLDRRLRSKLVLAHLLHARNQAEAGEFNEARAGYQAAVQLEDRDSSGIYCKWAACEIKAGDADKGEELLSTALTEKGNRLAVTYSILIETIRLKLPGKYKKRFNDDFNSGLAEQPTAEAVTALAETTAVHDSAGITYVGQKTHHKKVMTYVNKAETGIPFTEEQLERVCKALLSLCEHKRTSTFTDLGMARFQSNPLFPLLAAENQLMRLDRPYGFGFGYHWRITPLLAKVERLARQQPPSPQRDEILERAREARSQIEGSNPFGRLFGGDPFGYYHDDDDEFEDDDSW